MRLYLQPGFFCSNDAQQCYDRISHNVAILSMMRLGMPYKPLKSLFGTLQQATHNIMTGYGLSDETYGGADRLADGKPPLQGSLQGNGVGPTLWVAISTVLIQAMRQQGYGALFSGALTSTPLFTACFAFVDDTDLTHTIRRPNATTREQLQEFQAALDCWVGCLRSTGGDIETAKSFWSLIDFKWHHGNWHFKTIADSPGDLTISSPNR